MKQKGLEFSVHTSQVKNPYVWCDKKNLNRALFNVLSNAYKFTPEGGSITVSLLETGNAGEGYSAYEMRVQDTGIGMSKEFVEKMFNAFERERTSTDSGVEGTGLGLSITKSIVDLMGGTIEVLTAPGSGTQIIFRLKFRTAEAGDIKDTPAASADPAAAEAPAASGREEEGPVDFSGRRLLLVEDNEINMEIADMILTQMGFIVEKAENGQIALDKVASSEPGYYDAVLMDIQMPVMDGYEATRAIRALDDQTLASIPIMAMTANAFKEDELAAEQAGMQAHIAKPLDVDKMMATIRDVLSKNAADKQR
jgi:CheY-like chemotaxis protein